MLRSRQREAQRNSTTEFSTIVAGGESPGKKEHKPVRRSAEGGGLNPSSRKPRNGRRAEMIAASSPVGLNGGADAEDALLAMEKAMEAKQSTHPPARLMQSLRNVEHPIASRRVWPH